MKILKAFKSKTLIISYILILCIVLTACSAGGSTDVSSNVTGNYVINTPSYTFPESTPTNKPIDELTYTDISVLCAGDIMYHMPQVRSAYNSTTGKYDFSDNFKYMKPIVSKADYAIVNFETTLARQSDYTSYPVFNSPLECLDSIKDTGFDMLLYANNHCYDYKKSGFLATLNHFKNYGFDYIGAKTSPEEKSYIVKDINGIKLGLLNFADTITQPNGQYYTINGITINDGCEQLMDIYVRNQEDALYSEVQKRIADMRSQGAELIIMFIHWGDEYKLEPVSSQTKVAQKLCNLGVDVIIGSHPHVIEPMEILRSQTNPEHSTICFYSLGNYISNQNRLSFQDLAQSVRPYTENGLTVTLNIRKYNTGDIFVNKIEYTPTWVHRYPASDGYYDYNVIPLVNAIASPNEYGLNLSDFGVNHANAALNMTDPVFATVVNSFNSKMEETINAFSQAYYDGGK